MPASAGEGIPVNQQLAPYQNAIVSAQDKFLKHADQRTYDREALFAMQALMKTDFAMNTANKNPNSVRMAMLNVASTGLTLNPANAYAYLVPRDGAIVLDISYKGLIKIATDTGSISWARADVVFEKDEFTYHGPAALPEHKANPFTKDRGEIVGCYCIAKTAGGDILCEVMPRDEIEKIRGKSFAYAKNKSGPWAEWFEQMCKKAVIKRASKTWPYTETGERLNHAIEVANASEGGYDMESDEERKEKRLQQHHAALGRWYRSVEAIKAALNPEPDEDGVTPAPDLAYVAQLWAEIPEHDQIALWLAPSKGGVFTTHEREVMKTQLPRDPSMADAA